MPSAEYLWAGLIIAAAVGVAVIFGVRQYRQLRANAGADTDERRFLHRTARRRLFISFLLVATGVTMAATYLAGWDKSIHAIGEERAGKAAEDRRPLDANERATVRAFGFSWVAVLLLLLAVVWLVAWDMIEVRRHWRRALTRIHDDRRDMLDRQIAEIRANRGYRNGEAE